jgi:hypothetical protein
VQPGVVSRRSGKLGSVEEKKNRRKKAQNAQKEDRRDLAER